MTLDPIHASTRIATAPYRVVATYEGDTGEKRIITFCNDASDIRNARNDIDQRHGSLRDVRVERIQPLGFKGERWRKVEGVD